MLSDLYSMPIQALAKAYLNLAEDMLVDSPSYPFVGAYIFWGMV